MGIEGMTAPDRIYAWPYLIASWLCGGWSQKRFQDDAVAYLRHDAEALASSEVVLAMLAEARNASMLECTGIVAEERNKHEPGPIFKALNEAMGKIEDTRFAALKETPK